MQPFKVGDWVRQVKENYSNYNICLKIKSILKDDTYIVEPNIFDIDAIQNTDNQFELWEPKENEWCWFWNKNEGHPDFGPRLAKFMFKRDELQTPMDFPAFHITKYKPINYGYTYDFCEPFIGELPAYLKDK